MKVKDIKSGDGYINLIAAVIIQAKQDYQHINKKLETLKDGICKDRCFKEKKDIEEFFRDGWVVDLIDVDIEKVLTKIKRNKNNSKN